MFGSASCGQKRRLRVKSIRIAVQATLKIIRLRLIACGLPSGKPEGLHHWSFDPDRGGRQKHRGQDGSGRYDRPVRDPEPWRVCRALKIAFRHPSQFNEVFQQLGHAEDAEEPLLFHYFQWIYNSWGNVNSPLCSPKNSPSGEI